MPLDARPTNQGRFRQDPELDDVIMRGSPFDIYRPAEEQAQPAAGGGFGLGEALRFLLALGVMFALVAAGGFAVLL